jgi:hypothetical protein
MGTNTVEIHGLAIESRHDNLMWIFTFSAYSEATVDAWVDQVRAYRQVRPDSNARFLVYDASAVKGFTFEPYLRQRTNEIVEDDQQATGRVAIVINVMPGVRHIFQLFLWLVGRRTQPNLTTHIFDKRESAIAWVEQACLAQKKS